MEHRKGFMRCANCDFWQDGNGEHTCVLLERKTDADDNCNHFAHDLLEYNRQAGTYWVDTDGLLS